MLGKRELRAEFRAKRQEIDQEQFLSMNARILQRLLEHPRVEQAQSVFSYVSFGREVDTRPMLRALLERGKRIFTPVSIRSLDPEVCYHLLSVEDPLLSPEHASPPDAPPSGCFPIQTQEIDLFLVPGLAWDREGYRVGFGGGFFDKLLARTRPDATKVGLAFDFQIIESFPRKPWDMPVDVIITEERTLEIHPGAKGN